MIVGILNPLGGNRFGAIEGTEAETRDHDVVSEGNMFDFLYRKSVQYFIKT